MKTNRSSCLLNHDGSLCVRVLCGAAGFLVFIGAVLMGGQHQCLDTLAYVSSALLLSKTVDHLVEK